MIDLNSIKNWLERPSGSMDQTPLKDNIQRKISSKVKVTLLDKTKVNMPKLSDSKLSQ